MPYEQGVVIWTKSIFILAIQDSHPAATYSGLLYTSYVGLELLQRRYIFMSAFLLSFGSSAKELRNIRSLTTAALLVALRTIFAIFSIQATTSLRISFSFLVSMLIGVLYGPVVGLVCGGIGDIVQFVIKPTGPYFFGFTLNAALAGLIYGSFLYGKFPSEINKNKELISKVSLNAVAIANFVFSALCFLTLLFAPYMTVTKEEATFTGNGLYFLKLGMTQEATSNVFIVLCIFLATVIITALLSLCKLEVLSLTVNVIGEFIGILAIYTDKKTTQPMYGYIIAMSLLALCIVLKLFSLAKKQQMDMKFLLLLTVTFLIDTLIVNVLLGTYWVSVMYGKGFAFYFTSRFIKNIVQLPFNVVLAYFVLNYIKPIVKKMGLINK